jgi:hypothetical protein
LSLLRLRDAAELQVIELATQVCPAPCKLDRFVAAGLRSQLDQAGIGRVAINLQDAAESRELTRHAIGASAVFKAIDATVFEHEGADLLPVNPQRLDCRSPGANEVSHRLMALVGNPNRCELAGPQ